MKKVLIMLFVLMSCHIAGVAQDPCSNCSVTVTIENGRIKIKEPRNKVFYYDRVVSADCKTGLAVITNGNHSRTVLARKTIPRLTNDELCSLLDTPLLSYIVAEIDGSGGEIDKTGLVDTINDQIINGLKTFNDNVTIEPDLLVNGIINMPNSEATQAGHVVNRGYGDSVYAIKQDENGYQDVNTFNYQTRFRGSVTMNSDSVSVDNNSEYVLAIDESAGNNVVKRIDVSTLGGDGSPGAVLLTGNQSIDGEKTFTERIQTSESVSATGEIVSNTRLVAPQVVIANAPTVASDATRKDYVDTQDNLSAKLSGVNTYVSNQNYQADINVQGQSTLASLEVNAAADFLDDVTIEADLSLDGDLISQADVSGSRVVITGTQNNAVNAATRKDYVDAQNDLDFKKTGGTITGAVIMGDELTVEGVDLNGNDISNVAAIDVGDITVTNNVTASTAPTLAGHLTNKAYVDAEIAANVGGGGGGGGAASGFVFVLGSDIVTGNSSQFFTVGLNQALAANKSYMVKVYGTFTSSNTQSGLKYGFNYSGSATCQGNATTGLVNFSSSAIFQHVLNISTAFQSQAESASVDQVGVVIPFEMNLIVHTTATGDLDFGFGPEGFFSVTLKAGTSIAITPIN